MKTYKHKTLWWYAKKRIDDDYRIYVWKNWIEMEVMDFVKKELIENSSDREEVVEKDWIRLVFEEILWREMVDEKSWLIMWRQAIEKHAPKQKFTRDDLRERNKQPLRWFTPVDMQSCEMFLKDNNLLSSD